MCDLHDVPGDKDAEEAVTDCGSESQIISQNVNLYSLLQEEYCKLWYINLYVIYISYDIYILGKKEIKQEPIFHDYLMTSN